MSSGLSCDGYKREIYCNVALVQYSLYDDSRDEIQKTKKKCKRRRRETHTHTRNESNMRGGTGKSSLYCLFAAAAAVVVDDVVRLYSVLFSVNGKVCIESCLVIKLAHMDFGHAEECATKRKTIGSFF